MKKTVIIALGGNLFVSDATHQSVPDQYRAAERACGHIVPLLRDPDDRRRMVVRAGGREATTRFERIAAWASGAAITASRPSS